MNRDLRILSLALLTWALGEGLFIYLIPLHMEELGASPIQIGGLMAVASLTQAAIMLPAGVAADRLGARNVILAGWILGLVTCAIMAATTQLWVFTLGWAGYGFSAWVVPPITSYIARGRGSLKPERALTLVFAAFSAGMIISPTLGGLIADRFGLRATFWPALVIMTISNAVIFLLPPQARQAKVDRQGQLALVRDRRFTGLMALLFTIIFALYLGVPLAPNYLQSHWGIEVSKIGLFGSIASLGEVILVLYLGKLSPRKSILILQATGMLYLFILLSSGLTGWLALAFFMRAGVTSTRQFIDALATRTIAPEAYGLGFAISTTTHRVANVAAAAAAGWMYNLSPAVPFQVGLLLLPITMVLTLFLTPRTVDESIPA